MNRMLIVGNGFDLEHDLKTAYWNFREYLEENHLDFLIAFEKMYNFYPVDFGDPYVGKDAQQKWEKNLKSKLWESFEEAIGSPDIGSMLNTSECILDNLDLDGGNVGIEDTMDEYWRNEYGFIKQFPEYVKEWIEQISTKDIVPRKQALVNDEECICLSFNYTDTLENVYHIGDVLHIHGSVCKNSWVEPIMGHYNRENIEKHKVAANKAGEYFDEGEESIQKAIAEFLEPINKDTDEIIKNNQRFFDQLSEIDSITIVGWSVGRVDIPYLRKVAESVKAETIWHVYWHDEKAEKMLEDAFDQVGITLKYRDFNPDTKFWD